ncbi:FAD/NAD(P)-binding oxidoreductase family protein [Wolffia australiana]
MRNSAFTSIGLQFCSFVGCSTRWRGCEETLRWPLGHRSIGFYDRRAKCFSVKSHDNPSSEKVLVIVGGGAAGIYAAIRSKDVDPSLDVLVVEKGKPLSKVKVSGGGRCNVTNGSCVEKMALIENYPRGNKELRGPFFDVHGPLDTMSWFSQHGVELKTEEDGRVFPVSNSSSTVIDCLLLEAKRKEVKLQTGKIVTKASVNADGKFILQVEKQSIGSVEHVEADFMLICTGSSRQGYAIAIQLGHSIIHPSPSLFTFKIADAKLAELSGIAFSRVKAKLKVQNNNKSIPQFSQDGPMLVTHWGLSGPVILRLSAWGARDLAKSDYKGTVCIDFVPDVHIEDVKRILFRHKEKLVKQKMVNSPPSEFGLVRRFWKYLLEREGLDGEVLWSSFSNSSLHSLTLLLKQCPFPIVGKGQFKDEFVTAGGVPLSEISLSTMESRIQPGLYFAGEVLNVDGVTGGFNFQNAWSGGYIAGTSIGTASSIQKSPKNPQNQLAKNNNVP